MTSKSVFEIIEKIAPTLSSQMGTSFGAKLSPIETIVVTNGNLMASLAYAGLFFPTIRLVDGIPFARFPTADEEAPFDCIHVNLLHHREAIEDDPSLLSALGEVLATVWNQALSSNSLPGKFVYDTSEGYDVLYKS